MMVTRGDEAGPQHVLAEHRRFVQAPRTRCPDEVHLLGLDEAAAEHLHVGGCDHDGQAHDRQDQPTGPRPLGREPAETDREHGQQQQAQPEGGQGGCDQTKSLGQAVLPLPSIAGGKDAQYSRDHQGHHQRPPGQQERPREGIGEFRDDWFAAHGGSAEVQPRHVRYVGEVLLPDGRVEAELLTLRLDVLPGDCDGVHPQQRASGITRRELHHHEADQRQQQEEDSGLSQLL